MLQVEVKNQLGRFMSKSIGAIMQLKPGETRDADVDTKQISDVSR